MTGPVSQYPYMNFINVTAEPKPEADKQQSAASRRVSVDNKTNIVPVNKVNKTASKSKSNNINDKKTVSAKVALVCNVLGTMLFAVFVGLMLSNTIAVRKANKADLKNYLESLNKLTMPKAIKGKIEQEVKKLGNLGMEEAAKIKNYINEVLKLNWNKPESKEINLADAQKILDRDHIGMKKVKQEVIEFLAMENHRTKNGIELNEPLIICMSGPPGTGKTSIAESIAEAMGRPFSKISLGGASEKAYIKGHRRVYVGSEPGCIIKSFQETGVNNPVILLDEIDKMGNSIEHGDPASALLDVLDEKQCKTFADDYIGIPYDLSNAVFIITSNDLSKIPEPLKDRVKIIDIPGYKTEEKIRISELAIKKFRETFKLGEDKLEFTPQGIKQIIACDDSQGVRQTVLNIKSIFKNVIYNIEKDKIKDKFVVDESYVKNLLVDSSESSKRQIGFRPS